MNAETILAVDLGRYKNVACVYPRATRAHTFRTIDTTPEDVRRPRGSAEHGRRRAGSEPYPGAGIMGW
jgi:hypothetical protein